VHVAVVVFVRNCTVHLQAMQIRKMDERIKREELIDPLDLDNYLRSIKTAEKEKIEAADIILCTCTTSASMKVRESTNIMQVR